MGFIYKKTHTQTHSKDYILQTTGYYVQQLVVIEHWIKIWYDTSTEFAVYVVLCNL